MSELSLESVLIQIKATLQSHKIKLWEPPYYFENASNETEMINLANNFCEILHIKFEHCLAALNELQNHAIDKLNSNEELRNGGLATLKIRLTSKRVTGGSKIFDIKIKLTENVANLRGLIASQASINETKLKLISGGKVLDVEETLSSQNVKNFQQILVLEIDIDANQAASENEPYDRIKKIRKDAETLLRSKQLNYFNLENQNGETVHLPEHESTSIMLALLLYEKGRVQLKKENYNDALILFLEADNEIQKCQSSIVNSIDNIALLNLDIVWCYLQLKSITQLPDADRRLQICEASFKRTYGENFERVKLIKDSEMSERCLIVRLKLLKAILYFYQNRRIETSTYLSMAEQEILELKVDNEKVAQLMDMGYRQSEAIIALRNTYNTSLDAAVSFILERRQKLKNARQIGKKESDVKKMIQNLGLKAHPKQLITLTEMGFPQELAALALNNSNNDLNAAINLLQTQYDQLKTDLIKIIKPDAKLLQQFKTFGFDETTIKNVLKSNINNFESTLEALLQMKNDNSFQVPQEILVSMNQASNNAGNQEPSTSTESTSLNDQSSIEKMEIEENIKEKEREIFDDLRNDLNHLDEDDEYLNYTLDKEWELLNQYKRALEN